MCLASLEPETMTKYEISDGGILAKDKFVIRKQGHLMRDEKGLPLLFDTHKLAKEWIKRN
jgi:hypothetical protein